MKRNVGIWWVILGILIIGILVTCSTNQFIHKQEGALEGTSKAGAAMAAPGEAPTQAAPPSPALNQKGKGLDGQPEPSLAGSREGRPDPGGTGAKASLPGKKTSPGPKGEEETKAPGAASRRSRDSSPGDLAKQGAPGADAPETLPGSGGTALPKISPLDSGSPTASSEEGKAEQGYYKKRLMELDDQIQKMRDETTDATTYGMKTMAGKELQLWDGELNAVYATIIDKLDDDAKASLIEEERKWMRERDAAAAQAAKKYSGGSLEGVEYTASLAKSTRQRTYDLVNQYLDILEKDKPS